MSNCVGSIVSFCVTNAWARGAVAALAFAGAGLAALPRADAAALGDVTTLAPIPADPGFPEGVAVRGNRIYVAGAAAFGTADHGPSKIHVLDRRTGALRTSIEVAGEALGYEHALSCIATDDDGRVYALSTQLGVLRFTKHGHHYVQESYGAPLPDLPTCEAAPPGAECAPTAFDMPPIVNDIVFDEDGFAYVTDSLQATIFRYAPGGGAPEVWFQSALLEGGGPMPFGVNGLRFDPARAYAYMSVTTSAWDPSAGFIYRVPLVDFPEEADLEVVHAYPGFQSPDGIAFGASGRLYVALAGLAPDSNAISVLGPDGDEEARYFSPPDADIPFDAPANLAFDNPSGSLIVVNHAIFSANPDHFALLKVFVGDRADPLDEPGIP